MASQIKFAGTVQNINVGNNAANWSGGGLDTIDFGNMVAGPLYAYYPYDDRETTDILRLSDFGFSLPWDATVDGIELTLRRKHVTGFSGQVPKDLVVCVYHDSYGSNENNPNVWSTSWEYKTYGGPSNLWGQTWTRDFVNYLLKVDLRVQNFAINYPNYTNVYYDYAYVTVYYHVDKTITANTESMLFDILGAFAFCEILFVPDRLAVLTSMQNISDIQLDHILSMDNQLLSIIRMWPLIRTNQSDINVPDRYVQVLRNTRYKNKRELIRVPQLKRRISNFIGD